MPVAVIAPGYPPLGIKRVFPGLETLANLLILNGLLKNSLPVCHAGRTIRRQPHYHRESTQSANACSEGGSPDK